MTSRALHLCIFEQPLVWRVKIINLLYNDCHSGVGRNPVFHEFLYRLDSGLRRSDGLLPVPPLFRARNLRSAALQWDLKP
jgi:hypothetical protein